MRSIFFELVVVSAICTACVGIDSKPVDTGIDVSSLLCAGFIGADGELLVPTRSTDGCTGSDVRGTLFCDGCEINSGQSIWLYWGVDDANYRCASASVADEGGFAFGDVAPAQGGYFAYFQGYIDGGGQTAWARLPFDVCSEDVELVGELTKDVLY